MENEHSRFVDALPGFVWTALPDGHVDFLNCHCCEYTGLSLEEAAGWGWLSAVHPEDSPALLVRWRTLIASGEPGEMEARVRRRDGVYRWFLISVNPRRDDAGKVVQWCGLNTDTDDLKRLDEALRLRESDDRKQAEQPSPAVEYDPRAIIDAIPMMAWCTGADGYCEFVNQRWLDYAGVSLDQVQGWGWAAVIHPDDLAGLTTHWQSSLAAGVPDTHEARMRRFDGVYRWFLFLGNPLRDESGNIVMWLGANVDIEDRKCAEESLRAIERNLIQIINTIPTTAWSTRPDGYCDFLSDRWLDYAGFTMEQALGWSWGAAIHPDDSQGLTEYWQACLASGTPVDTEARIRRHDGVYRWFLFRANPLRDESGTILKWYGTNVDIEDRKRADQALQASENSLSLIVNTIPMFAWSTRTDGYCDFLNQRWLDYAGMTVEQARGWAWGAAIHPDDSQGLVDYWQSCLATGTPVDTEARMRRYDGVYRWFLFRANPLRDESGTIVRWYGTNVDIEDRKRADEELRASEVNLRELTETIPEMLWSATAAGAIDYCNTRFLSYTGSSAQQLTGADWGTVIHPEDAEGAHQAWMSSVMSGAPYHIEARAFHVVDGTYRWCALSALPLFDEQQRILRWHGTAVDIHDRKLAQEELRQSERDARLIVDCIPAQVAVLGPAGEIKQINRRMAEWFGDSVSALSRWKTGDIVPPDELPRVRDAIARAFATGQPFQMENHLRRFDGVYRWFQVRGSPLIGSNGQAVLWYFLLTDIEERKHAEEALRRSEAFLAEAQRISSTGSFSWQLDTDEITFSDELYRIFEFSEDSPVSLERIGTRVHPHDIPLLSRSIDQVRGNGGYLEYEMRLRMADGRIKYIRTLSSVIAHPDARRECLGAIQDVTQRHLSNDALDKARSDLAHVNRSMSLGALTASIAHEINQPLSGIVTNASTCLRSLTADPPNIAGALETARRTIRDGNRAADMIARLRALFTKKAVATETVDLNDAAREVISLLSRDLQRSRVILQPELSDDSLLVTGDRVQLQQVIVNLVRNASDAMSGVDDRPRQLLIRTDRDPGDQVRLTVQDVGIGLEPTDVDRLFDAFYTTKNDGMGIGLSVSRSIIERHRGRLWAEANAGPGATFAFAIPSKSDDLTVGTGK